MKYHCEKCGLHFDYPKADKSGHYVCPQCGAPAIENPTDPSEPVTRGSSTWAVLAKLILAVDIIAAVAVVLTSSSEGINWMLVGCAAGEVAFVALLCGIVCLLDDIHTTLKVNTAQNMSRQ